MAPFIHSSYWNYRVLLILTYFSSSECQIMASRYFTNNIRSCVIQVRTILLCYPIRLSCLNLMEYEPFDCVISFVNYPISPQIILELELVLECY